MLKQNLRRVQHVPLKMSALFDLREQLRFYKFYHHQRVNVLIHMIFVPTILFVSCCMLNRISLYGNVTLAHLLSVAFSVYYLMLCVPTGMLASGIILVMNVSVTKRWVWMSFPTEMAIFVVSWIFQFVGHGVFERRKPALLDSLVQSLVLAPYFVLFELLFEFGFMPKLRDQLERDVSST